MVRLRAHATPTLAKAGVRLRSLDALEIRPEPARRAPSSRRSLSLQGSTLLLLGRQRSVRAAGLPGARRVGLRPGDDARAAVHGAAIGQHEHGQLLLAA